MFETQFKAMDVKDTDSKPYLEYIILILALEHDEHWMSRELCENSLRNAKKSSPGSFPMLWNSLATIVFKESD